MSLRHERACSGSDLRARETGGGAVASQPLSFVTVTNTSHRACTLHGHPAITAAWAHLHRLRTSVHPGSLYEVPDPGATLFSIGPGQQAWFALGTGTAFDSTVIAITRVRFAPASAFVRCQHGLSVAVSLPVNARTGQPYGIGVTAFAPGSRTHA